MYFLLFASIAPFLSCWRLWKIVFSKNDHSNVACPTDASRTKWLPLQYQQVESISHLWNWEGLCDCAMDVIREKWHCVTNTARLLPVHLSSRSWLSFDHCQCFLLESSCHFLWRSRSHGELCMAKMCQHPLADICEWAFRWFHTPAFSWGSSYPGAETNSPVLFPDL